jgi:outer membrane protein assembly factor BamB
VKAFFLLSTGLGAFLVMASPSAASVDDNWPQWRGPRQDGTAPHANPPVMWNETNNIKWKIKIPGEGSATPIVWEKKIFVQTAVPTGKTVEPSTNASARAEEPARGSQDERKGPPGARRGRGPMVPKPTELEQFTLVCVDRDSGKILWQKVAREEVPHEGAKEGDGTFASPSGVTDGSLVFAYFGSRGLYCYDMDGNQKWRKDLGKMQIAMSFGEGSSPALYKDTLIVNWDNEGGSYIVAFDKKTGKELWKKDREERTSWSTPLVIEHDGKPQAVVAATGKIRSYDVGSGDVLWECSGLTRNVIPSPVADKEKVYCASGFMGNALLAIKLNAKGDATGSDSIAWKYSKSTPYVPSPLLYDGKIYFLASNNGRLSCLDSKDGKVLLDAESLSDIPNIYASPLGAGGKVYLVGRNGTTVVLKDTGTLEMLATNKLGEKVDASPVAVGKDLLLRAKEHLYCISETGAQ